MLDTSSTSISRRAQVPAQREHPPRQAEKPVEVVELVDLRENDTAAERAPRRVHRAVVLVRVPSGQILPDLGIHRQHAANAALPQQFAQPPQAGVEPHLVADQRHELALIDQIDQRVDFRPGRGERLFDVQVAPGLRRGQGHVQVQAARVAYEDHGRPLRERLVEDIEGAKAVGCFQIRVLPDLESFAQHRRLFPHAVGIDLDIRPQQRAQVAHVALADAPQPGDQHPHEPRPISRRRWSLT